MGRNVGRQAESLHGHNKDLRTAHHYCLLLSIGWKIRDRTDHVVSFQDALARTDDIQIEATMRKGRILFAGFEARMGARRLQNHLLFRKPSAAEGERYKNGREWS